MREVRIEFRDNKFLTVANPKESLEDINKRINNGDFVKIGDFILKSSRIVMISEVEYEEAKEIKEEPKPLPKPEVKEDVKEI